jgi:hypothetical protein
MTITLLEEAARAIAEIIGPGRSIQKQKLQKTATGIYHDLLLLPHNIGFDFRLEKPKGGHCLIFVTNISAADAVNQQNFQNTLSILVYPNRAKIQGAVNLSIADAAECVLQTRMRFKPSYDCVGEAAPRKHLIDMITFLAKRQNICSYE